MNQFVLITGASRGIGKAIAISYAQAGYNLYLTCKKMILHYIPLQLNWSKTTGLSAKHSDAIWVMLKL